MRLALISLKSILLFVHDAAHSAPRLPCNPLLKINFLVLAKIIFNSQLLPPPTTTGIENDTQQARGKPSNKVCHHISRVSKTISVFFM